MKTAGKSITGKRPNNEDALLIRETLDQTLLAVSDGMGGHAAGETASRLSVQALEQFQAEHGKLSPTLLRDAFKSANQSVYESALGDPSLSGMGATLVCALIRDSELWAANVGDSRLYLIHDGAIRQVTRDHSFVAELVARNIITEEEAKTHPNRNVITRAIGTDPKVKVDLFNEPLQKGDIVLLCSDGLSGVMEPETILSFCQKYSDPGECCDQLIENALALGSKDNITVVIGNCPEEPDEH